MVCSHRCSQNKGILERPLKHVIQVFNTQLVSPTRSDSLAVLKILAYVWIYAMRGPVERLWGAYNSINYVLYFEMLEA